MVHEWPVYLDPTVDGEGDSEAMVLCYENNLSEKLKHFPVRELNA